MVGKVVATEGGGGKTGGSGLGELKISGKGGLSGTAGTLGGAGGCFKGGKGKLGKASAGSWAFLDTSSSP